MALQAAPGQWPRPSPGTNSPPDWLGPGSACRIAFGPGAGQKVFTVQGALTRDAVLTQELCADQQGLSLYAAVRGDSSSGCLRLTWSTARTAAANSRSLRPSWRRQ